MKSYLTRIVLSPFLIVYLAMGGRIPVAIAADQVESNAEFAFSEKSASVSVQESAQTQKNALKGKTAPISSSGALTTSIPIDVPPGRLGMTPSLSLTYSSSASRSDGEVGAGWSLQTRAITRSTRQGFPPVAVRGTGRGYDEARATFESPYGPLVPVADGPAGLTNLYAPQLERSPVRFQRVMGRTTRSLGELGVVGASQPMVAEPVTTTPGDYWIEHDPSGVKRFYGEFRNRSGRTLNELGTHAWYLLEEVDRNGNSVSYDYHPDPQGSSAALQQVPVLASVRWGGNGQTGLRHAFMVKTIASAQAPVVNMMAGQVRHALRLDALTVQGADAAGALSTYWRFALSYVSSADTGRALLSTVERWAPTGPGNPDALTRRWRMQYSGNGGVVRWDPAGADLPSAMLGAYVDFYVSTTPAAIATMTPEEKFLERSLPSDERAGTKFIDFDGDGRTDSIYHSAGLVRPDAPILKGQSYLQSAPQSWLSLGGAANVPTASLSELADLDRDLDADGLVFASTTLNLDVGDSAPLLWEPNRAMDSFCTKVANSCCTNSLSCDGNTALARMECIAGRCPDAQGIEALVYPADRISFMPTAIELANRQVVAQAAGAATGPLCGAGPRMCTSYYWNSTVMPGLAACPNLTTVACDQQPSLFCSALCKFQQAPNDLFPGRSARLVVVNNAARCGAQSGCGASTEIVINRWPEVARQVIATRVVKPTTVADPVELYPERSAEFYAPLTDANGDGLPDIVLLKQLQKESFSEKYVFLPRVYLNRATSTAPGFKFDREDSLGWGFTESLAQALTNSVHEACYVFGSLSGGFPCGNQPIPFPVDENFNSFFSDVNADGLPDLVLARAPSTRCEPGHRVLLNRGHRWEVSDSLGAPWSSPINGATDAHPWQLLQNYQRSNRAPSINAIGKAFCARTGSEPIDRRAMSSMAQADLNADGRTDVAFVYRTHLGQYVQRVFLNTPSGYQLAPPAQVVFPNAKYGMTQSSAPFVLAQDVGPSNVPKPLLTASDMGRMVDLDGDGLVDLVTPGACERPKNYEMMLSRQVVSSACKPPRWHRNLGVVPDLLTAVDTLGGGFFEAEYVAAVTAPSTIVSGGQRVPGLMLLKEHRSGSDPARRGFVDRITLRYENFVRDLATGEAIGFERIEHRRDLSPSATEQRVVTVNHRFDVQESVAGVGARFPLRGTVRESHVMEVSRPTPSSQVAVTELRESADFSVTPLGAGARIREAKSSQVECLSSRACVSVQSEVSQLSAHGFPMQRVVGDYRNGFVSPASTVRTFIDYDDDTVAWQLGRVRSERAQGYSQTIAGAAIVDRVLSSRARTYDARGRVAEDRRVKIGHAGCGDALVDDVTTFSYGADGLVERTGRNGTAFTDVRYDSARLCVAERSTNVDRYIDGRRLGTITRLAERSSCDVRNGKVATRTDLNGNEWSTRYDSLGRPVTESGPGQAVLSSVVYKDDYPASSTAERTTDPYSAGARYWTKTFIGGAGEALAALRWTTSADAVRTEFNTYDQFGRVTATFAPERVAVSSPATVALSSLVPGPASSSVRQSYDGFDRLLRQVDADGVARTFEFAPRESTATTGRGTRTVSIFDWQGGLIGLRKLNAGGTVEAEYSYVRDGLGRLVEMVDADLAVRRFERDGAGRIYAATLPHQQSVTPRAFGACYDFDDQLISSTAPSGRLSYVERDRLGRPIRLTSSSQNAGAAAVESFLSYDEPTPGLGGLGRLTRVSDPSGVTEYGFDAYGYPELVAYAPSSALRTATSVQERYVAHNRYSATGRLTSMSLVGESGALATQLASFRYDRDAYGRVQSIESVAPNGASRVLASGYAYDEQDRTTYVAYENGASSEWAYNKSTHLLEWMSHGFGPKAPVYEASYSYDPNRNLIGESTQRGIGSAIQSGYLDYDYDQQDRLIKASSSFGMQEAYAYSAGGNVLLAGAGEVYTYARPSLSEAVTSVATPLWERQLAYDADGRAIRDAVLTVGGKQDQSRALSYDAAGCLSTVDSQTVGPVRSASSTTYTCDHRGHRVARETYDRIRGTTQRVIKFGDIAEIRPDDGTFLVRLSANGTTSIEEAHDLTTGQVLDAESSILHKDLRGSVVAQSAYGSVSNLTVARAAEYGPWGETQSTPQAPLPSHGYIDNEADPDLGYHQFGARTYDPKLRRWLSPDPRVFAQPEIDLATTRQLNLYSYAGNDPARHSDPSGELVFLLVIPAISLAEAGVFAALATATVATAAWAADQPPPSFAAGEARIRAWTGTPARTAVFANSTDSGAKPESEVASAPANPTDTHGDSVVAPAGSGDEASPANEPALPESYWENKKAPTQVEPGIQRITDQKPSGRSKDEVYERTTHYDEYGRQVGQTHQTDHGQPGLHPKPHHHTRDPATGQKSDPIPGVHPSY